MKIAAVNAMAQATVTCSVADPNYPAANAKRPDQPFTPAKTTVLGTQSWVIDFGSPVSVQLMGLAHVNFATARWQGNTVNDWAAPPYDQALTVTRCPWQWRYQHTHLPGAGGVPVFTYRWARLVVSGGALDGAAGYRLGGIWAGTATETPTPWRWQFEVRTILPKLDQGPDHDGWRQRLVLGDPRVHITAQLASRLTRSSPGVGDALASWSDLLRQLWAGDMAWLYLDKGDPSAGWPVRPSEDITWRVDAGLAEAPWELDEIVGP